jgi:hypothetical protein
MSCRLPLHKPTESNLFTRLSSTNAQFYIQRDSKRWTQFRTSIFPELYIVCE